MGILRYRLSFLSPPPLLVANPVERKIEKQYPPGRWNLYVGGAGAEIPGYVNIDLFPGVGVDVVCSVESLPFASALFQRVECDAVLEHVRDDVAATDEIRRCLKSGGLVHFVVPFCHPFHAYPDDYRRYTRHGIEQRIGSGFEILSSGWRTGPTATLLVFFLEYLKSWSKSPFVNGILHVVYGWLLFPLRYLDLLLFKIGNSERIGNHHYVYAVRK